MTSQLPDDAKLNWQEIYRRLEEAAGKTQGKALTAAEKQRILEERARQIARKPVTKEAAGKPLNVVEFLLAHERYAFEVSWVREVFPLKTFTPLPCTPPFVLGLVNVHGRIVCVNDIRKFFDLPEKGITDLNRVIVLEGEGMELGVLADAIVGVRSIQSGELQPALPTLGGVGSEYLVGVTPDRVVVLDGGKLLRERRLVVKEEV
ncbi:MAG: chemotaxis protein CheW [Acidobacteriota bacterium]